MKRKNVIISVALSLAVVFGCCMSAFAAEPIKGDVNKDSYVTAVDALLALQISAGKSGYNNIQKAQADMNNDGVVTAVDALMILKVTVKAEKITDNSMTDYYSTESMESFVEWTEETIPKLNKEYIGEYNENYLNDVFEYKKILNVKNNKDEFKLDKINVGYCEKSENYNSYYQMIYTDGSALFLISVYQLNQIGKSLEIKQLLSNYGRTFKETKFGDIECLTEDVSWVEGKTMPKTYSTAYFKYDDYMVKIEALGSIKNLSWDDSYLYNFDLEIIDIK